MTAHPEVLQRRAVAGRDLACVLHDEDSTAIVLFCHGFRGERTGPNRTFVRTARGLAALGISSLRFDQHGSGDSPGDFAASRFTEWVDAIRVLAEEELERGRRVALLRVAPDAGGASLDRRPRLRADPALPGARISRNGPDVVAPPVSEGRAAPR